MKNKDNNIIRDIAIFCIILTAMIVATYFLSK